MNCAPTRHKVLEGVAVQFKDFERVMESLSIAVLVETWARERMVVIRWESVILVCGFGLELKAW